MAKALAPIDFANPAEGVKKMIRKMEQEEAGVREDVLASSQGLNDGKGEARVLGSEARELNRLISGVVKKMESAGEEEVQDPDILVLTSQSLCTWRSRPCPRPHRPCCKPLGFTEGGLSGGVGGGGSPGELIGPARLSTVKQSQRERSRASAACLRLQ